MKKEERTEDIKEKKEKIDWINDLKLVAKIQRDIMLEENKKIITSNYSHSERQMFNH